MFQTIRRLIWNHNIDNSYHDTHNSNSYNTHLYLITDQTKTRGVHQADLHLTRQIVMSVSYTHLDVYKRQALTLYLEQDFL